MSDDGLNNIRTNILLWLTFFYGGLILAVGIASLLISHFIFPRIPGTVSKLLLFSGIALMGYSFVWAYYDGQVFQRPLIITALVSSITFSAAIWSVALVRHRNIIFGQK